MATKALQGPLYLHGGATGGSGNSEVAIWPGGQGVFNSEHTGGTVSLEFNGADPSTDTWIAVGTDTTLAASGAGRFYLPAKTRIRANGGAATGIYSYVNQVGEYLF